MLLFVIMFDNSYWSGESWCDGCRAGRSWCNATGDFGCAWGGCSASEGVGSGWSYTDAEKYS